MSGSHIRRFDTASRRLHLVLMTSFLALAATGLPLLFAGASWAGAMARLFGGYQTAGYIHRFFGAILLGALVWHIGSMLWRALVKREHGLLWGPDSIVVQPRDFVDFGRQVRWFAGLGPPPRFERFTYWEKFDYWAVLWGTALMGAYWRSTSSRESGGSRPFTASLKAFNVTPSPRAASALIARSL